MKLKTLKDLKKHIEHRTWTYEDRDIVLFDDIKSLGIKWVKRIDRASEILIPMEDIKGDYIFKTKEEKHAMRTIIKHIFNLTEKDLK